MKHGGISKGWRRGKKGREGRGGMKEREEEYGGREERKRGEEDMGNENGEAKRGREGE